ncbi:MAG TPA: nucleotidyltransferase domain-containing protein [Solirubrobacterales bacterium]|nr:nucleotidyltransferase domain-containing protein [Solirubrobacterales bacterium]
MKAATAEFADWGCKWGGIAGGDYDGTMSMTDEALIEEAGRRLSAAAPDADVILFGSRARCESRPDSDLDLLVIEPEFSRRGEEYGRLRKELRGLDVAIDLVIYRKHEAEKWGNVPGSFLHRALGEGRVLAGA